ncbi:hypothetical protein KO353_14160 [Elioraea tepida]|jgi:hypothetical protein|uniref:Yip1 domain-containing protein n=1 Tax=Elioraea tepida TaxID=2843330 RepID=A0A975YJ94_9PROT|nr:hypothetical protein [Elioraea tepida]QXM24371.1 hypothetical protein KO353_14160 [Elioraea tepida]
MSGPASPLAARIVGGVAGAFLLARGRAQGMALIDRSSAGAWASFAAMWLCAPGYVVLRSLGGGVGGEGVRLVAAEAIGYVIGWFAFPLLMVGVVEGMGRRDRFPGFVAAWNWAKLPQLVVVLVAALAAATGLLPGLAADVLGLAALAYALWLSWFVARQALGIDGARAGFVVGADVLLGLFVTGLTITLSRG